MTISREYITMAAIRRPDGTIFRGYRHATIIHEMGGSKHPDVQGFITSQNRFVEREEALKIARAARQMAGKRSHPTDLFSEDIWPTVDTTSPAA